MAIHCPKCRTENPDTQQYCGACGTRLGPADQLSVTKTLETTPKGLEMGKLFAGRFELIEELGAGGMGRVYRAFDKEVGEEIALKVLHPEIALDERTVDRFRNEIKLARKITHRNVCRMHELHQEGTALFITMEYVPGQDLKGLIREAGVLPTGKAISIAKQVAEGLAEAHDLGVIHRDLKPQNIMVDNKGNAKIMDFGVARSLRTAGMTAEGIIIGTPEYMAPEQVEGLEADQRTDIYALGSILFEMMTWRAPFEGDSPLSIAYKHKNEIPMPPRKLNVDIPEPLDKLILRCLEKEKENRYQTADELLADLIRIEEGLPISERVVLKARPAIKISRAKPSGLKRWAFPALGVVVLVLAALFALRILPKKQTFTVAPGKPSVAVVYFENISGDPSLEVWKTGLTELLITGLQQSRLLRVLDGNRTYSILKKFNLDRAGKYSREDLIKVANEGRATYTASGSLMKAGESIVIMLTLQKPHSGEVLDSIRLTCQNEAEILAKTDELAAKIKSGLELSPAEIAADSSTGIDKLITNSPDALKYFLEALRQFRMLEFDKVVALCEKAVELDPQFARAYVFLASGNESQGKYAKGMEYRQKAFDLKDRLPASERYLVEANYYLVQPEQMTGKLMEAWEKYFEFAPDDVDERESLGRIYAFRFEDYEKSLEQMEMVYRISQNPQFLDSLTRVYERMGYYDKAEKAFLDYLKTQEDNSSVRYHFFLLRLIQRKYDLALSELEKAYLLAPSEDWDVDKGYLYLLKGDLREAEKLFLQVTQREERAWRNAGRRLLYLLDLQKGRFSRAAEDLEREMQPGGDMDEGLQEGGTWFTLPYIPYIFLRSGEYERALDIISRRLQWTRETDLSAQQRLALWWKGIVTVEAGMPAEAETTAAELKALCEQGVSKKAIRFYHHLQGLINLQKGDYSTAIANLKKAVSLLPFECADLGLNLHALFLFPLGRAYYANGDFKRAEGEFRKITLLTEGRSAYGDLYAKSFYMLGKIAEEKRDRRRAAENYRQFLEFCKDADPGQLEVEDARARLAAIEPK